MKIFREALALSQFLTHQRRLGSTIGFVPTMGALHQGHASLIHRSNAENDLTVVSIFVNPLQFNSPDDLAKYPITTEDDIALLQGINTSVLFLPSREEIYPNNPLIKISFGYLEDIMEGKFRPGHFQGVGMVVAKLLHIVHPDRVYFGQKDLQQCAVIRSMMADLSFMCQMVTVPTVREHDGLAMSSRNLRLSGLQRLNANRIFQALKRAQAMLLEEATVSEAIQFIDNFFKEDDILNLEYFQIVDSETLLAIDKVTSRQASLCMAVHAGSIRLIDNIFLYDSL